MNSFYATVTVTVLLTAAGILILTPAAGYAETKTGDAVTKMEAYSYLLNLMKDKDALGELGRSETFMLFRDAAMGKEVDYTKFGQAMKGVAGFEEHLNSFIKSSAYLKKKLTSDELREFVSLYDEYASNLRFVPRIILSYSLLLDHQGAPGAGFKCVMFCLQFASDVEAGGTACREMGKYNSPLIGKMLATAIRKNCYKTLFYKISRHIYSDKIVKGLMKMLKNYEKSIIPLARFVEHESRIIETFFKQVKNLQSPLGESGLFVMDKGTAELFFEELKKSPHAVKTFSRYIDHASRERILIDKEIVKSMQHGFDKQQKKLDAIYEDLLARVYGNIFTSIMIPSYQRATVQMAETTALGRAAQIACLLELYRLKRGTYPKNLKAFKKIPVPTDPFSGKPIVYFPDGEHYLLVFSGEDSRVTLTRDAAMNKLNDEGDGDDEDNFDDEENSDDDHIMSTKKGFIRPSPY